MIKQSGLSKNELNALREISIGNISLKNLAKALGKSRAQIYRISKSLYEQGFIEKDKKRLRLQKHSFVPLILDILNKNPKVIPVLADSGITILKETLEYSSIEEIESKTGLKNAIIYRKLMQARKFSIIKKDNKKYLLNSKIWPDLKEFLEDYKRYLLKIDYKLDADILIRGKSKGVIIVESNKKIENSNLTAFSVYPKYGIKIFMPSNYYHIPEEKLDIKQIFKDSLIILNDDKDYRKILYTILFYIKNKRRLKGVKHELVGKFEEVFNGEKIENFPSLEEIKEKAKQYDIKI
jgi:predicted DNA-binding transcriptional regulator AlpA